MTSKTGPVVTKDKEIKDKGTKDADARAQLIAKLRDFEELAAGWESSAPRDAETLIATERHRKSSLVLRARLGDDEVPEPVVEEQPRDLWPSHEAPGDEAPRALIALARPSRALETVLRVRGFQSFRVSPEELLSRALSLDPVLIVQDPFTQEGGWQALYDWKREPRLANASTLLVRSLGRREDAPLGDVSFLARPLGRVDLPGRIRSLLAARDRVNVAVVARSPSDPADQLESILVASGVSVTVVEDYGSLLEALRSDPDLVFAPFTFDGEGAERLLEALRERRTWPQVVFTLAPDDPENPLVTALGDRVDATRARSTAETLDRVIAQVLEERRKMSPTGERGIIPSSSFLYVLERYVDYSTRHGQRFLVLQVAFAEDPADGNDPVAAEDWQDLSRDLAQRFRFHDVVSWSQGSRILLLLVQAGTGQIPMFTREIIGPVRKALIARKGRALPELVLRHVAFPEEGSDLASLLPLLE